MSLPAAWVEKLFHKLAVTYGQGFLRQYDGVSVEEVKANWGEELSVFQQNPDAIRYGLEHLPADKAPTVLAFRDLCRKRPEASSMPTLPPPPVDPEVARKVRAAWDRPEPASPRHWAEVLRAREECGDKLTLFQRNCWREALTPAGGSLE